MGLKSYGGADEICSICLGNRGARNYKNLLPGADWRSSVLDNTMYMLRLLLPLHAIASSRYFNKYFYRLDLLHLLERKGAASDILGNVLALLVRNCDALGRNQDARLDALNMRKPHFTKLTP